MRAADFEVRSPEFRAILAPDSEVEKLAEGFEFTEGPCWVAAGGYLLFSDIPHSRIMRWSPTEGVSVWRDASNQTNGNTLDREGRLISCEHRGRRVTRTEKDGAITVLADRHAGGKLNSPNDVVVKSDGTIWFTDPPYGLTMWVDPPLQREQAKDYVFRLDPGAGGPTLVADDLDKPNGLCFSPDERRLYIADSSARRHIRVFEVGADNTLQGGQVFAAIDPGGPDGMRCDTQGRLYSTAGDGVHVFNPGGQLLGKIKCPLTPANCTFGGPGKRTLFLTARTALFAVRLAATGAQSP